MDPAEPFTLAHEERQPGIMGVRGCTCCCAQHGARKPQRTMESAIAKPSTSFRARRHASATLFVLRRRKCVRVCRCRAPDRRMKRRSFPESGVSRMGLAPFPRKTRTASFWGNQRRPARASARHAIRLGISGKLSCSSLATRPLQFANK